MAIIMPSFDGYLSTVQMLHIFLMKRMAQTMKIFYIKELFRHHIMNNDKDLHHATY
jgi:hypothetical protein